ncbi:hypothetical protein [Mesorhizobium sp. WSM4313]|uniref:hypothetical protein n=1 Tax=Mesorhizobium sp. WSM4313 TaxID=2029412 RepID=UPI000BB01DCD|nr:hypothetical protein [Mesorhizobium sp. WSM4313]PBB21120.1 hypothetical protein CK219_00325 [Mesorhizobium sp. WSM4313]
MKALKAVWIVGLLSSLGGCSNSEPRYQVSEGSIATYLNPNQSQPTTILLDRQTAKSWYLTRTGSGEIIWFEIAEPLGAK